MGTFEKTSVHLEDGQEFTFDLRDELGDEKRVKMPHPEILHTLDVGDILLLDDGKLRMKVLRTTMNSVENPLDGEVVCKVNAILSNKLRNKLSFSFICR